MSGKGNKNDGRGRGRGRGRGQHGNVRNERSFGAEQTQGQSGNVRREGPFVAAPTPTSSAWRQLGPATPRSSGNDRREAQFIPAPVPRTSAWGARQRLSSDSSDNFSHSSQRFHRSVEGQTGNDRREAQFVPGSAPTTSAWGQAGPATPRSSDPSDSFSRMSLQGQPGNDRRDTQFVPAPVPTTSAWGARRQRFSSDSSDNLSHSSQRQSFHRSVEATSALGSALLDTSVASSQSASLETSGACTRSSAQAIESTSQHVQSTEQQRQQPSTTQGDQHEGRSGRGKMRERRGITDIIQTRPDDLISKRGIGGTDIQLTTNYFKILKSPKWQLYQYRVDFSPEILSRVFQNRLIKDQKANLGGYLFDGTMLYLTVKLRAEITEFMAKDKEDQPILIKVKYINPVSMRTAASIQVLNLILRRSMGSLKLQLLGRNFFDAVSKVDITAFNLQIWPGYQTSIRQHETDILVCVDVTSKVVRTQTILDILKICSKEHDWKQAFMSKVLGLVVFTPYNNKMCRIDDVDFDQNPKSTFLTRDGEITFIKYYQDKYNLTIRDEKQPLLIQKASEREERGGKTSLTALVPELCWSTGLTEDMRRKYDLMKAVSTYTRLAPKDRIAKLKAFNNRIKNESNSEENFKEWDFKLDNNLVTLSGRILPPELIYFGNNKQITTNSEADWSQELRNVQMHSTEHVNHWIVIVPSDLKYAWDTFLSQLRIVAKKMQFTIADPKLIRLENFTHYNFSTALDEAAKHNPQLIVCVLSRPDSERYSTIKKKFCVKYAIPTQVLLEKTISVKQNREVRSLLSIATKVAIQINSKLGGVPWMLNMRLTSIMTVGFDVYHDKKDKRKSYAAMVATMDNGYKRKYFSVVNAHTTGEELSDQFAMNMTKALICYNNEHKMLPERIFIYRDGVGDGELGYVLYKEVRDIVASLKKAYGNIGYKMTFIVVSKRINTRFFFQGENPPPGTVVDDVVTLPERHDFFLVSQSAKSGTVTPTSYNILHNRSGLNTSQLQMITYKNTHLYYNWSGTLRVPAVCQYAHKLAYLVGNFIHIEPSNSLEKRLYFL